MISLFLSRVYRSIKIDPDVFDEVQKDKSATLPAAIVVLISSSAAGFGASHLGMMNFFFAPVLSLLSWFIWSYIVYFVGVKCDLAIMQEREYLRRDRALGLSSQDFRKIEERGRMKGS